MAEPPANPEPYVFLSYTSVDRDRVLTLADRLETVGIRVWVDRRSLVGGMSWDAAIVRAIKDSTVFAVLCTPASVRSPNVMQELRLAWEEQRPTLPLLLAPVSFPDEMRYILAGRQWVELLDRTEDAWLPDVLAALAGLGIEGGSEQSAVGSREGTAATPPVAAGHVAPRRPNAASVRARRDAPQEPVPATNLPAPLTSFIGREQEVAEVAALLAGTRLLTLIGPGGTGKTRLALAVASRVALAFPAGTYFVDLSAVTDPMLLPGVITQVLGLREAEGQSPLDLLRSYLRSRHLLLVLDNFEQVVEAAPQVTALLAAAPAVTVLVTSRVVLHVAGEREYAVPSLPLTVGDAEADPAMLQDAPAVALFVARAQDVQPSFALTAENAAAIAGICRRLDGIPLAIELAAARVRILTPRAILERLAAPLTLLTTGARDLPERQRSLRAAITWSYDLLDPGEQRLFRRLAVFAGGCTLEAAESICAADTEAATASVRARRDAPPQTAAIDVLDGVESLVEKSLLRRIDVGGATRFRMLETIREFGLERLAAAGEDAQTQRQYATIVLELAEEAEPLLTSAGREPWLEQLDAEIDNLRAALAWCRTPECDAILGMHLAGALAWYWYFRGMASEGRGWLEAALAAAPGEPADRTARVARARALSGLGLLVEWHGDHIGARRVLEESIELWRVLGDRRGLAYALYSLEWTAQFLDDYAAAERAAQEMVALCHELGDAWGEALALCRAGTAATFKSDFAPARAQLEASLACFRLLGDGWGCSLALRNLGALAFQQGQFDTALPYLTEAAARFRETNDTMQLAFALVGLMQIAAQRGDSATVAALNDEGLRVARDTGNRFALASFLNSMGETARLQGDYTRAGQLYEESIALTEQTGGGDGVAYANLGYGYVRLRHGDLRNAGRLFTQAVTTGAAETGYTFSPALAACLGGLAGLAGVAAASRKPERAARLLSATAHLLEITGQKQVPPDSTEFERDLEAVRARLGEERFASAWAEGQTLTLEQAIAYALENATSA